MIFQFYNIAGGCKEVFCRKTALALVCLLTCQGGFTLVHLRLLLPANCHPTKTALMNSLLQMQIGCKSNHQLENAGCCRRTLQRRSQSSKRSSSLTEKHYIGTPGKQPAGAGGAERSLVQVHSGTCCSQTGSTSSSPTSAGYSPAAG